VLTAQGTTVWRFQSTWPARDPAHLYAAAYAQRVNEMTGGRFRLDLLAAGAVVPAFQMQDAVHAGVLDGGHGVSAYWYGKNKAYSLFGTTPPWGWDANNFLAWMNYGGGYDLYNELVQQITRMNIVGFQSGPMFNQPLGWFKNEITSADQLRGMKYRTVGLAADLFREMGAAVTILPGGEIVPAIERGLIDGAEFNNPMSDLLLGFPDVAKNYMLQSYHQACETYEILFNKAKYDALSAEVKAVLKYAAEAASADMSWKATDWYARDYAVLQTRGVKMIKTPDAIKRAQLEAWDKVISSLSSDAFFKKVCDSQRAWARRTVALIRANQPADYMDYDHFNRGA
jgi:TRAP-type mannitol/chloroaromatic compound transport system substrate-binding protein